MIQSRNGSAAPDEHPVHVCPGMANGTKDKFVAAFVGGFGLNSLARMRPGGGSGHGQGGWPDGVTTFAVNDDRDHLDLVDADYKFIIGEALTGGCGTMGRPELGVEAVERARAHFIGAMKGTRVFFLVAGLGGGMGMGGGYAMIKLARELGAFTVALLVFPFVQESETRRLRAAEWIEKIRATADCTLLRHNTRLLSIAPGERFQKALARFDGQIAVQIRQLVENYRHSTSGLVEGAGAEAGRNATVLITGVPSETLHKENLSHPLVNILDTGVRVALDGQREVCFRLAVPGERDQNVVLGVAVNESGGQSVCPIITGVRQAETKQARGNGAGYTLHDFDVLEVPGNGGSPSPQHQSRIPGNGGSPSPLHPQRR